MAEQRTSRGVPLPSVGQIAVIAAALVAAWLVSSGFGLSGGDSDDPPTDGNPVGSIYAVESTLHQGPAALPELMAALDSGDPQECSRAAYGLGRLGPAAAAALDKLLALLAADDPRVRTYAVFAVAQIQTDKQAAAAAIAPLLADAVPGVRDDVRRELLDLGTPAYQPIVQLLESGDASLQLGVMQILTNTRQLPYHRRWLARSPNISQVLRGLVDAADPGVRIEALTILAEWDQAQPAEVCELLRHDDPQRIGVALRAIGQLKSDPSKLLPGILDLFDRFHREAVGAGRGRAIDETIVAALSALSSQKTAARSAAPRLLKLLEEYPDQYWIPIARALADIGADTDDVIRILSPLLLYEKHERTIAWQAGELLLEVSPAAARRQVAQLLPKLADDRGTVDKPVLYALCVLGPQAEAAVPALIPLLHASDPWVAEFAAHALSRLGPAGSRAVADLTDVVTNGGKPQVPRLACVDALASVGAGAQSAIPALLQYLAQPEPSSPSPAKRQPNPERRLRAAIVRALGRIGGDSASLHLALRLELSSRSSEMRAAAAEAVARVAGQSAALPADQVLGELIARLGDEHPKVRTTAALAISRMAIDRSAAIAPLTGALLDEEIYVQKAAAVALGKIGPAASDALPLLRAMLADVRSSAMISLDAYNIPELESISLANAVQRAVTGITGKTEKIAR
ncbi:MAG TPA: HEAT repeat domain-containing protein [Planctomycetaceae bacterium]|jgi:HEAT repeat protein